MNFKKKSNGTAPEIETMYEPGQETPAKLVEALNAACDSETVVDVSDDKYAHPAKIHEAAVIKLPTGSEVVYVRCTPPGRPDLKELTQSPWRPLCRVDKQKMGSHEFLVGRSLQETLHTRHLTALEQCFGRKGQADYISGPALGPNETCEPCEVAAALLHLPSGSSVLHGRYRGLWFALTVFRRRAPIAQSDQELAAIERRGRNYPEFNPL